MDPTLRFVELVNGPTADVDLTEGWLLLGAHADPTQDSASTRARLADIASQCREGDLSDLRRLLFDELGFVGDAADYYDPDNTFLGPVLDRRRGLPIALSGLMLEVGRLVDVPLVGVGLPGHFMLRHRAEPDVFIDPFAGGTLLDRAGCEQVFRRIAGPSAPFDDRYLEPVSSAAMLGRMTANLVNAYRRSDNRHGLRWAARLRARCPGVSPQEATQLALSLAHCGAYDEAGALMDGAADVLSGTDADRWRREAQRHLARLN